MVRFDDICQISLKEIEKVLNDIDRRIWLVFLNLLSAFTLTIFSIKGDRLSNSNEVDDCGLIVFC